MSLKSSGREDLGHVGHADNATAARRAIRWEFGEMDFVVPVDSEIASAARAPR